MLSSKPFQAVTLAVFLMMMLAGCVTSSPPIGRQLPETPDWLRPVPPPAIRTGMDARTLAARTMGALDQANDRLSEGRAWYERVKRQHAEPAQ